MVNKRVFLAILALVVLLTACSWPAPVRTSVPTATEYPPYPSMTSSPTFTLEPASPTFTPGPTDTPQPTPTVMDYYLLTPTPWPTPTPGTPLKRTPSAMETCPNPVDQTVVFQYRSSLMDYEQDILAYIQVHGIGVNSGKGLEAGLGNIVTQGLGDTSGIFRFPPHLEPIVLAKDLTGDGRPEMVVILSQLTDIVYYEMGVFIIGCHDGEYQWLYEQDFQGWGYSGAKANDLNDDGIQELVVQYNGQMDPPLQNYQILEWDGSAFKDVLAGDLWTGWFNSISYKDIDGNATLEILAPHGYMGHGLGDACYLGPFQNTIDIYMWLDGNYSFLRTEFTTPVYRYQAAFDGDNYAFYGLYDQAKYWYEQAIDDPRLKPASRGDLEQAGYFKFCETGIAPDPNEGILIRAYASYRWMILEAQMGDFPMVQRLWGEIAYEYPESTPGYPYTEMALVFWHEYQTTQDAGQACQRVREWVPDHVENIFSLFDNYGWMDWVPDKQSICPF